MKSKILAFSLVVVGFVLGASALSVLADWSGPQSTPPNCVSGQPGCDAPLNVGANVGGMLQAKLGGLSLNTDGVGAIGLKVLNGIQIIDFDPSDPAQNPKDKVLTSNENGVGTWKGVSSVGGSNIVFVTPVTLTPSTAYSTYSDGSVIPVDAKAVILEGIVQGGGAYPLEVYPAKITIRVDGDEYVLAHVNSVAQNGGANVNPKVGVGAQGVFPLDGGSFQYKYEGMSASMKVIGYISNGGSGASTPAGLTVGGYTVGGSLSISPWGVASATGDCPTMYRTVRTGQHVSLAGYSDATNFFQCLTK